MLQALQIAPFKLLLVSQALLVSMVSRTFDNTQERLMSCNPRPCCVQALVDAILAPNSITTE